MNFKYFLSLIILLSSISFFSCSSDDDEIECTSESLVQAIEDERQMFIQSINDFIDDSNNFCSKLLDASNDYENRLQELSNCAVQLQQTQLIDQAISDAEEILESSILSFIQDEIDALEDAILIYNADPTSDNCNDVVDALEDYINATKGLEDCAREAGELEEFLEAIEEAEDELAMIEC